MSKLTFPLALTAACTIEVQKPALDHPTKTSETVQICPAQYLQTSPVAEQCCYASALTNDNDGFTLFYNSMTDQIVTRYRNPYGFGCRASDGISACSGAECFYGPLGFSRPEFRDPPVTEAAPYWTIFAASTGSSTTCQVAGPSNLPFEQTFISKSGINAPGQGCPGGDPGNAEFDY